MPGISFDRAAEYYDATRGYAAGSAERIRDSIVRHTNASMTTRFLELGVGTGRIALPFIQAGYNYTGVDLSPAMLGRLRAKLADGNTNYRYDLREADVTCLPFNDATFDVIIAVHVLHLVSDWQQAIREAQRVLRPGGFFLIAHDTTTDEQTSAQNPLACTPHDVRTQWNAITRVLHVRDEPGRGVVWGDDDRLEHFLRSLGATVQSVELASFQRPPLSAREMAERCKQRMYSSDWKSSDALHADAVQQLEQWMAQHCTDADTPISTDGTFEAIVARWPAHANEEDES